MLTVTDRAKSAVWAWRLAVSVWTRSGAGLFLWRLFISHRSVSLWVVLSRIVRQHLSCRIGYIGSCGFCVTCLGSDGLSLNAEPHSAVPCTARARSAPWTCFSGVSCYISAASMTHSHQLTNWNPYNLSYAGRDSSNPAFDAVVADGRNGGLTPATAYDGTRFDKFFRTPEAFFTGTVSDAECLLRACVCVLCVGVAGFVVLLYCFISRCVVCRCFGVLACRCGSCRCSVCWCVGVGAGVGRCVLFVGVSVCRCASVIVLSAWQDDTDPADTSGGVIGVLDPQGNMRRVRASGKCWSSTAAMECVMNHEQATGCISRTLPALIIRFDSATPSRRFTRARMMPTAR